MITLRSSVYAGAFVAILGGIGAAAACNGGDGSGTGSGGSGATTSGTGAAAGHGGQGTGGFILTGNGGEAGSTGEGGGCAGTSIKAEKQPLDLYLMLDQSGSMKDAVAGGGDKWAAVTAAIATFVQQPAAFNMGIGLQYFPLRQPQAQCPSSCTTNADCGTCGPCFMSQGVGQCLNVGTDSCTASDYATPEVDIQTLPAAAADILGSLMNHVPAGATPTSAALQGAVDYASAWASAHTDHVTIVVLATDGDPTECDTLLANINAIAAGGANGTPKVLTFVIGVGTSLSALNGIAAAGGTSQAFIVDTSQDVNAQFLAALNAIQGQALGCVYGIPTPVEGQVDYNKVNVAYTPGNGGGRVDFPKVDGPADCTANLDAWYYDDNLNPTQILLCDSTCNKVKNDPNGKIDIVLGCQTIVP